MCATVTVKYIDQGGKTKGFQGRSTVCHAVQDVPSATSTLAPASWIVISPNVIQKKSVGRRKKIREYLCRGFSHKLLWLEFVLIFAIASVTINRDSTKILFTVASCAVTDARFVAIESKERRAFPRQTFICKIVIPMNSAWHTPGSL